MKEPRSSEEILKALEDLASTPGYMHVLSEIASRDLFFDGREAATVNWRERITYQELSLMVGLALKSAPLSYDELPEDKIEEAIKVTRSALEELHMSYTAKYFETMSAIYKADGGLEAAQEMSDEEKDKRFRQIFGSGSSMVEATFYDDSGSYDFQYLEMAPRLYQFDSTWIAKTGLDFNKAKSIYEAIKRLSEVMHHGHSHPELVDVIHKGGTLRAIDQFVFSKELLLKTVAQKDATITVDDLEKFFYLFSAKPEDQYSDFSGPGTLNIVNIKPLIEIADDAYFIPVNFNLAEAIYQSPAYWMRQDTAYLETAAKNRGMANEQITYEYFQGIFGNMAFKTIKVMKGKKTTLTDIDVMGVVGSVAIVAQNKGKRMTIDALKGNEEILKNDFKQAIQAAYNQGIQSREVLLGDEEYKFIDEDGNEIKLPQGIEEVYILCVTADVYPAALHQLDVYLEKEEHQPWPVHVSLFDLDMLALYLPDPYEFAFYLKQRSELHGKVRASGEMALLGYHLNRGLFKPDRADMIMIDQDYAQLIDADYMYRKGRVGKPPKKHALKSTWSNVRYDQLVGELKTNISDPKLTDIIFYLKTIPPHIIDGIIQVIDRTRLKAQKDGLPHNFSMPIYDEESPWGGFSYATGHSLSELRSKLSYLVRVNKYKHKADRWLGIGALIGQPQLTNAVLFGWEPWERSEEMDELAKHHDAKSKGYELSLKALQRERRQQKPPKDSVQPAKKKAKAKRKAQKKARRLNRKKR